ncbi:hypothetical protein GGF32_005723 [Allomyces javanicus]|nr:hypothetical protein GGF32_005723 [Allomyces javanicus]
MRDDPSSEAAGSTANFDLTRVHFYAATNALFIALEAAHRAKNLSTSEWAFDTPEARESLLDYIMQRLDQTVLAMDVDTIQLAQPYKPTPRLRPMKLYRALARRLPTFKSDPATLLTNAQMQQDVRAMFALWIDDTIAGSMPPLIETGWVPRATGKEYSVPNPFLRGRAAGKVRFNVAAMAKPTDPDCDQHAFADDWGEEDDIEDDYEDEDEDDDIDDASGSNWSPLPRMSLPRRRYSNDADARWLVALLVGCFNSDPVPVADC